jgi:hypothetical protein
MRPEMLADSLAATIRGLHTPLALRLAALEQITAAGEGAIGALESVVEAVADRLTALEARAPVPGPQGDPGPPGPPGPAGADGKSLNYLGVYVHGKTYDAGDLATDDGSVFYCCRTTEAAPGTSKDWQLMVKRGRDARGR